jgi:ubiquinone/menaquinone biosynthesis C-methylase UbiE
MRDHEAQASTRTRRSYDEIAARFLERTRDRAPLCEVLDRFAARVGRGSLVLDVGAGPGSDSAELRERGLRVISLDLSLGMLRSGRSSYPGPRVQADMVCLPFRAGVHGLWVNASLLHVERERVPAVLAELRRVLVAPAVLHVSVKQGTVDGWEVARYGPDHPRWFTYWEPVELDRVLAEAGFRVVEASLRAGTQDTWLVRLCTATPGAGGVA